MPFQLKLAVRFLRSARKGLVRFTSLAAIIGIAAGVASLIMALAIADGFTNEIQNKVLGNSAHITVSGLEKARISNWRIVEKKIRLTDGVESVQPTTFESAVLLSGTNSSYSVLRVNYAGSDSSVDRRSHDEGVRVSLGKELAAKLELKHGDRAEIVTINDDESPKTSAVIVGDIFETGLYEYDSSWIYISDAQYEKLKESEEFVPAVFSVKLKDVFEARDTADKLRSLLGGNFKVLDWQEANKPLFAALSLEKKLTLTIIALIVFVAALNITTTLALLVNERRSDLAVLRTCGAKTRELVGVFVFEGITLGLIGMIIGLVVGLAGCVIGNELRLVSLPREVYSLEYIPFEPSFMGVLTILFLTFLLCVLATIYPSIRVSKIKPLENLKAG